MNDNEIELLNSEGMILLLVKKDSDKFIIYDFDEEGVAIFNKKELINFLDGNSDVEDCKGRKWNYREQPEDMKPDKKKLDDFIGI